MGHTVQTVAWATGWWVFLFFSFIFISKFTFFLFSLRSSVRSYRHQIGFWKVSFSSFFYSFIFNLIFLTFFFLSGHRFSCADIAPAMEGEFSSFFLHFYIFNLIFLTFFFSQVFDSVIRTSLPSPAQRDGLRLVWI